MKRLTIISMMILSLNAPVTFAKDSGHHSGQASKHSALAASEGLASTATVASAAVAVPVIVVAGSTLAVGSVVAEAGASMADSASASHASHPTHHHTLVITERTITADPAPNAAINKQNR